jgi:hypothetical protein
VRATEGWRQWFAAALPRESFGPLDLALRLTLLDLLLKPIGDWWLRPFLLGLAAAGLLLPRVCRERRLWWLLAALAGIRVLVDWPLPDNHAYLLGYWLFAIALALGGGEPARTVASSARLLVGLAFAFASVWKLGLSPDYLDGRFFRVALLTDPRFEDLARLVGGLSAESLAGLREFLGQHVDGPPLIATPVAQEPSSLTSFAYGLTLWTAFLESTVAAAFLWPRGRGLSRVRDALLLLFCVTTYAIATVEGFAWLLLAMGVAQCERSATRLAYLATFFLVLVYREVPWLTLLLRVGHG